MLSMIYICMVQLSTRCFKFVGPWDLDRLDSHDRSCREEVSARLTGFLHAGEAMTSLEPRRRRQSVARASWCLGKLI